MYKKLIKSLASAAIILHVLHGFFVGLLGSTSLLAVLVASVACTLVVLATFKSDLFALPVSVTGALFAGSSIGWSGGAGLPLALIIAALALAVAAIFACFSVASANGAINRAL